MKDLASKLAAQVDQPIRSRGNQIFWAGKVSLRERRRNRVRARVQGSAPGRVYDVTLTLSGTALKVLCECPYFEDQGACKHIWATILAADLKEGLEDVAQMPELDLDDSLDPGDDPVYEEEEDEDPFIHRDALIAPASGKQPAAPIWQQEIDSVTRVFSSGPLSQQGLVEGEYEILYVLDPAQSMQAGRAVIQLMHRTRKKDGAWSALKDYSIPTDNIALLPNELDREALAAIHGSLDSYSYFGGRQMSKQRILPETLAWKYLPTLATAGRLWVGESFDAKRARPLEWDDGEPWRFTLEVRQDERDQWEIRGALRRGDARMELDEPEALLACSLLVARGKLAYYAHGGAPAWLLRLRDLRQIRFPDRVRDEAFRRLLESGPLPQLEVDEPLRYTEQRVEPRAGLRVTQKKEHWGEEYFLGQLLFDYGSGWEPQMPGNHWREEERILVVRDTAAEAQAEQRLRTLGMRTEQRGWRIGVKNLPKLVRELLLEGWHVEAEGKAFRKPGASRLAVSSGVDWFDLHGEVDYGGVSATLPELLAALRRGETMVRLGDGTYGLLPEEWLSRLGTIAGMGQAEEGKVRFRRGQAGLLDALLAAQPEATCDEAFALLRDKLASFRGIAAAKQPPGFKGTLRSYQKEGLGWIEFLREFGFGGCLADDMGVGKTAQVLAALEQRRAKKAGPSLVVAPKSLMFNWKEEAARFTPKLRVLEHTGLERDAGKIADFDLVLTTYGTLRRDVVEFKDIEFDYVVLDEAQAIKNASTESAKAARLLRGRHRLALSGTPVENHLGELWSLFEFLNPGMLGEAKALKLTGGLARNPDPETRALLASALRPFILRRTKKQVAAELPEKTEQTIFCEMEPKQRKQYDELRQHYRDSLLGRVAKQGLAKSKMHVLEALLRLRQAACHPALLDARHKNAPSAKLDELLERIEEIREEGSKALVFSQFTSLLDIVRGKLHTRKIDYEYLDGSTRDRRAPVERFQTDPNCGLFLISLKAGGLGLNLTAAEYVFLLDPWWNPAVEAQAVDRAHRIGQTRNVFAYRLITRGTVEEKVLELQKSKRDLADAIIGEDNSLLRDLKREDLELLLS